MSRSVDDGRTKICGFLHYRLDLGEGMQTAVFFDHCHKRCVEYCKGTFLCEHPTEYDESEKGSYTADELIEYLLREQRLCASRKLSIFFTGGEPLMDPWFCFHLAKALKENDMGVIFRTCGCLPSRYLYVVKPYADLFLFDLFTMIPSDHKRLTGFPVKISLDALDLLERNNMPYRLRLKILPGINDMEPLAFASFCGTLRNVKSVILDFSRSQMTDREIRSYRNVFLEQGIVLY